MHWKTKRKSYVDFVDAKRLLFSIFFVHIAIKSVVFGSLSLTNNRDITH